MDFDTFVIEQTKNDRDEKIDILKTLAIICMVAGHSGAPFTDFVYLFHMAVFFIASGYFFKEKNSDSLRNLFDFLRRKIKQLWVPFFVWNTIFVGLHNVFIDVNVYTNNPILLNYVTGEYIGTQDYLSFEEMFRAILEGACFSVGPQVCGAFWFLRVLFCVSVFYCCVDYLIKRFLHRQILLVQFLVSLTFLFVGFWCSSQPFCDHGVGLIMTQILSYYILYYFGYVIHFFKEKNDNWNWKCYLVIVLFSFGLLLILGNYGSVSLASANYKSPLFLLLSSLLGWWLLYGISYFIARLRPLKTAFVFVGKRTLSILIFHFLSLKIVAVVVSKVYDLPSCCIAAFPNLYGERGMWWIAYTAVGVAIPVLLNVLYAKAKNVLKRKTRDKYGF